MAVEGRVPSSFRDPSGHLFVREGDILRQINEIYREDYETLMGFRPLRQAHRARADGLP